jgi:hypothetical protein
VLTERARISLMPPGAYGTMKVIGLLGKLSWAVAGARAVTKAIAVANPRPASLIALSWRRV